ncbi:hypothetical protein KQI61_19900 [Anaerocolumna aminovalerica]|nr:hypothetical protein [Anaerocolumna aminovalerica]MBU5334446.1 hypothetical protein [Anaerocolumna aminovalerica]
MYRKAVLFGLLFVMRLGDKDTIYIWRRIRVDDTVTLGLTRLFIQMNNFK